MPPTRERKNQYAIRMREYLAEFKKAPPPPMPPDVHPPPPREAPWPPSRGSRARPRRVAQVLIVEADFVASKQMQDIRSALRKTESKDARCARRRPRAWE